MKIQRASLLEDPAEFDQARSHHRQVGHHVVGDQERVEGLHDLAHLAAGSRINSS